MKGHVFLIGAGPGDPGLITVKGLTILRSADVVVYDALANPELLKECKNAELINVGKRSNRHTKTQAEINDLLVSLGKEGKNVVRLKGGDPFLFGRGAEEAEALIKANVDVSVVPGVSSSIAVPELAGIPVTHRKYSSLVTFLTGHEMDSKETHIDWGTLVKGHGTLVILMGMKNAGSISSSLIDNGMMPDKKVGIITNGSTSAQRTLTCTLADLQSTVEREHLEPPGIIVIGDVVSEREALGDLQ
ncbi:MAG: uroporphyrinogen-III C-methyltransferase [Candidatus Methanomethylophilaceae archaeon]